MKPGSSVAVFGLGAVGLAVSLLVLQKIKQTFFLIDTRKKESEKIQNFEAGGTTFHICITHASD